MKFLAPRLSALCALTALTIGSANASIVNFITLTEGSGGLGESAWSTLSVATGGVNVAIRGLATTDNDAQQFAYLDWGNAGLGVCKDASSTGANTGSGTNRCNPSSDDNVTVGESLSFVFDQDVFIKMWFNNNHDGGFGTGDKISIAGTAYNVMTGYANSSSSANGIGFFQVPKGFDLRVAYANEEFYMSGMEVIINTGTPPAGSPPAIQVVPEPASLALTGLALLGLAASRRRRG